VNNCVGIINLDENESRMGELVRNRPLAAMPIAARYRLVDFVLSNMTNSGIESIGVFAKNKSRALIDHLKNGRPWDLHRKRNGLKVFNFGCEDPGFDDVHNFSDNIEFIKYSRKKYVILAPTYMLCNIDYNKVLDKHIKNRNEITVVYKNINNADRDFVNCDILNMDNIERLLSVGENTGSEYTAKVSMEMYIMSIELFIDIVEESIRSGMYRKIKEFINSNLDKIKVGGYEFIGYLACINSLNSYYLFNMDLLKKKVNSEVFFEGMPIYTKTKDESPTHYTEKSNVKNSIIANGCYIEGEVKNSVIGRRVYVAKGAKVENCIILQNTVVGQNATLSRVIADKGSAIKASEKYIGSDTWPVVMKNNKQI
jgi:glucose-1-phosphate adenylyltransferase